jgi:hypothetical protein
VRWALGQMSSGHRMPQTAEDGDSSLWHRVSLASGKSVKSNLDGEPDYIHLTSILFDFVLAELLKVPKGKLFERFKVMADKTPRVIPSCYQKPRTALDEHTVRAGQCRKGGDAKSSRNSVRSILQLSNQMGGCRSHAKPVLQPFCHAVVHGEMRDQAPVRTIVSPLVGPWKLQGVDERNGQVACRP